jgi:hypothetical protein
VWLSVITHATLCKSKSCPSHAAGVLFKYHIYVFRCVNFGIQTPLSPKNSCGLDNHHTLHTRTLLSFLEQVNEFNSVCSQHCLFSNHERGLKKIVTWDVNSDLGLCNYCDGLEAVTAMPAVTAKPSKRPMTKSSTCESVCFQLQVKHSSRLAAVSVRWSFITKTARPRALPDDAVGFVLYLPTLPVYLNQRFTKYFH